MKAGGEAARVLVAALEYAEPGERDALAMAAIETGRGESLRALVRWLDRYGPEVAKTIAGADGLEDAIEAILDERQARSTHNAVRIIEASGRADLLHLLLRLLDSALDDVAHAAGEAFLAIVVQHVGERGRRCVPLETARKLDYAIADALETYPQHRKRRCLLAAAIAAARPGPRLATMLDDDEAPAALAMRAAVRDLDDPLVRRNLLHWLGVKELAAPAQRWMHGLRKPERFSDLLASGHLLRDPKRRRALRRVDRPQQCVPSFEVASTMDESSQRWLPDLIASLGLATEQRIARLREVSALPNLLARLRAAHDLAALASNDEAARRALEIFCFDRDRTVSQYASSLRLGGAGPLCPAGSAHHAAPDGVESEGMLARLLESNRTELVKPARIIASRRSVTAYFEHFLELSDQHRLAIAHRLIVSDRTTFVAKLRDRIALSLREERLAAIAVARHLRIIEDVADAILVQTASTDPRIASAAVACLGQTQHPHRSEAARTALRHTHPRVRANAIEAIAALGEPPLIEIVAPMMHARENRVRANAICAVIERKPDAAEPTLRHMLRDLNPLHRVSALWVVKRSRASAVLDELAAIAITDPLPPVRERAAVVKRSLLVEQAA